MSRFFTISRVLDHPLVMAFSRLHQYFDLNMNLHLTSPLLLVSNSTMFPPSFTSCNGSISILVGAWSPSPNYVDSDFYLVANDLITFLPPTENGPTHVFLGFATFGGLIILARNGLVLVIVNLASFIGHTTPSPILVCLPSFANIVDHVKDHLYDLEVIFNDSVIELSNS